ncbi:hypothetical protein PFFVO_05102 [Plasmodium falciparum Vietnam Oak-Knoll (FVO)]|uniref:Small-subunit processome Utp12 domain-containing protein n=1 Tax=Plasmodium falciparum Vietnam Oak-Knoll (FVO) TaxID=1036723 RepID=A0A024V197_PLAFA|nr:hypothetical protein PFFVO_05102 [Plasmodium falciparum Vietnam Oak-Knoll (FVO)]
MVKSYDRYEYEDCLGIVNSKSSNCVFLNNNNIISGHDECVGIWNINEKEIKKKLSVPFLPPYYFFTYHVTYICLNDVNKNIVAVGYTNGSIRLFDMEKNKILSTFSGHTSGICKLKFNENGNYLCSCSKDTNIILWDIINDKGVFKLEGHTNVVTDIEFLQRKNDYLDDFLDNNILISVSKDCLIKVWELNIQTCVQTIVDCEEEITSLIINQTNTRLIVACNSFLKIYKINLYSNHIIKDTYNTNSKIYITFLANIKRPTNCRIQNMKMIFFIDNEDIYNYPFELEDEKSDNLLYSNPNNQKVNNLFISSSNGDNIKQNEEILTTDHLSNPNLLLTNNNNLNTSIKYCERARYSVDGDNSGLLICCTNLKKIEFYKINSIKNQKKSEKNKKKRYIEKLKKKKIKILNEKKKIEKFKGKESIDYNFLNQKLEDLEKELFIYNNYDIHTANDEIKYLFNYNYKFKLQNIDVMKKKKKDNYIYLLVSFMSNRLSVYQVNLYDILHNKDNFVVMDNENKEEREDKDNMDRESDMKDHKSGNNIDSDIESGSDNDSDNKSDSNIDSDNESGNNIDSNIDSDNKSGSNIDSGEDDETHNKKKVKIVQKKIYDYSKCFKEISEINKGHNSSVDFLNLSSNNELLVSICKKYVKIWNMNNLQNIITINLEGCTNAIFCNNDESLIISDECGYLYLYELKNIELKYTYKAHANKIINLSKKCNQKNNNNNYNNDNYYYDHNDSSRNNDKGFLSVGEENYLKIFEYTMGVVTNESSDSEKDDNNNNNNNNNDNTYYNNNNDNTYYNNNNEREKKSFIHNKRSNYKKNSSRDELNNDTYNKYYDDSNDVRKIENCEIFMFKEIDCYHLSDKVSCAMYSPDGKYICIGYLNNLIEILYSDTLKLHLTLYGHSLPITCMDISKDNKILASSGADKFIFLWNMEYGNVNKRIHTECDVVNKIQFFNKNNNLISISRDGYIKMWDAIKFQCICTVDGNFGILKCLVINHNDDFFLTSGTHKSIRIWKKGEDLIFLEEERDKELNLQIEKEAIRNDLAYPSSVEKNVLLNKATIKTIETIKSSEKLIEYLDIIEEEIILLDTYYKNLTAYEEAKGKNELPDFVQPPTKPLGRPELLNKDPHEFIIEIMCNIKNNILNEVLISLPFSYAYKLLDYIKTYLISFHFFQKIQDNYKKYLSCGNFNFYVEYSINIVLTIINIYRNQFLFDNKFRFLLYELQQLILPHLKKSVDQCAFNQTTLNFLMYSMDDDELNLDHILQNNSFINKETKKIDQQQGHAKGQ